MSGKLVYAVTKLEQSETTLEVFSRILGVYDDYEEANAVYEEEKKCNVNKAGFAVLQTRYHKAKKEAKCKRVVAQWFGKQLRTVMFMRKMTLAHLATKTSLPYNLLKPLYEGEHYPVAYIVEKIALALQVKKEFFALPEEVIGKKDEKCPTV